nr:copia protein [Tanacetum cinerariifolium]
MELPLEEDVLSFIKDLGYSGYCEMLSTIRTDQMHQPWRTFVVVINKCISGKTIGLDRLRESRAQILWDIEISLARKEHMPYPRFTKVIINHFISKDNTIFMRNMINLHTVHDDTLLDVPDEKTNKTKDTSEGTRVKPRAPDVSKEDSFDNDDDSWGDSEDESDDVHDEDDNDDDDGNDDDSYNDDDGGNDAQDSVQTNSNDDENPSFTLKDYEEEEEQDEEYMLTPDKDKYDDKDKILNHESNNQGAGESSEDEMIKTRMKSLLLDQTEGRKEESQARMLNQQKAQSQRNQNDQPDNETAPKHDRFKKRNKPPTPDRAWNKSKSVDFRPPHKWISTIAKARQPPRTFDELMGTTIDFSAYVMNRLKIDNLTQEILVGILIPLSIAWRDADAALYDTENESEVYVSPSSGDKTKKHDEKENRKAKGKSPIDLSTGVRDLSDEFEEFSINSTNRVNAFSAPVTAVGPNSTDNTNSFNVASPTNTAVSPSFEIGGKYSFMDPSQYPDDLNMPTLEDITYLDDEENVGAEADFSNLEKSIIVSPIPITRVHKDHPVTQIISNLSSAPQTRSMPRMVKDQGGLTQINDKDFYTCMFACFLSQEEPKREEGIDYEEFFALVARIEAIRLFLAYTSFMGFLVYQMDVKSAFLYKTFKEEVYVYQPPGFKDLDYPDKVYKVVKVIYGLHQAPKAWRIINAVSSKLMLFGLKIDAAHLMLLGHKTSVLIKKANDVMRLQALIDRRKVIITEDTIGQALHLDDVVGVDCLPNEEIFAELARIGYEKPSAKLTFYKAFFSAEWKFLIHTIL